ncbi:MAG: electron transport complex subunit RsxC [Candidatus Omnitrophica bacterium]|nr:electron transport complex subunit RsxC [Candidatus Omnitrophota bacterium]
MIHVKEHKEPQHGRRCEKFVTPKKLYLPLSQHIGKPAELKVKLKDQVNAFDALAEYSALVSSRIHAPLGGVVTAIDNCPHPVLLRSLGVTLQCTGDSPQLTQREHIENLHKDELLGIIKDAGIVGMGGACFPTYLKLSPPQPVDTFLVNGCECEPYLACDYRLMEEETESILRGAELVARIIDPKQIYFCIEENKPAAIKKFNLALSMKKYRLPESRLVILKSQYPQGGERQLIHQVTRRAVPCGKLPFDVGCLVQNVATLCAIYEAVYFSKPLVERIVTFAGDCLREPKNLWVKIGTSIKELFDEKILEFDREPEKVIHGGPMMGISIENLDYPILKGTSGVLFFSKDEVAPLEGVCIRCGRCVDACPMNLFPSEIIRRVKHKQFDRLDEVFLSDCIECGCCTYVCPAKIPLVHYIKEGKRYAPKNK